MSNFAGDARRYRRLRREIPPAWRRFGQKVERGNGGGWPGLLIGVGAGKKRPALTRIEEEKMRGGKRSLARNSDRGGGWV
jgi:hypothetical protein